MRSSRLFTGIAALTLLWSSSLSAQSTVETGTKVGLTIRGFISATGFAQDQPFAFGNGQSAEYPLPPQTTTDRWFGGGDVRNTRLGFVFDGPKVSEKWKVNGTLEADFFGGNNGTGAFAGQQLVPRLRLAFVDLTDGRTTLRIGQQWAPLFGNFAVSLSHVAFPLGYGSAGDIGWRYPGIFLYRGLTAKDAKLTAELQFAVMAGSWNGPGSTTDSNTAGNASFPQAELRFNVGKKLSNGSWGLYVVGHVDRKDLTGPNSTKPNDTITGSAAEFGAKLQAGAFMIQGNVYNGRSIGQHFGAITQFQLAASTDAAKSEIQSTGGWAQVGYDLNKKWSLFAFAGMDDPKDADVLSTVAAPTAARLKNVMFNGMLRWKSGPVAIGAEFMHVKLTTGAATGTTSTTGNQISLSTMYTF